MLLPSLDGEVTVVLSIQHTLPLRVAAKTRGAVPGVPGDPLVLLGHGDLGVLVAFDALKGLVIPGGVALGAAGIAVGAGGINGEMKEGVIVSVYAPLPRGVASITALRVIAIALQTAMGAIRGFLLVGVAHQAGVVLERCRPTMADVAIPRGVLRRPVGGREVVLIVIGHSHNGVDRVRIAGPVAPPSQGQDHKTQAH